MKSKIKELIMPVVVLTLIATVMSALLGGTNALTADRIEKINKENEKKAVTNVIDADEVSDAKEVEYEGKTYKYYVAKKGGKQVGLAFAVSDNGYGGAVAVVVGFGMDGKITAIEVTDASNETPGLGQNAKRKDFTQRFAGVEDDVSIVKNNPKQNEIQAVTGATITSKSVARSVNLARKLFNEAVKEGA